MIQGSGKNVISAQSEREKFPADFLMSFFLGNESERVEAACWGEMCALMMSRGSVVVCDSEQWTPLISHCLG